MIIESIILVPIFLLLLFRIKLYDFPSLSFLILFAAGRVFNFERVRNKVGFQLVVYAILFAVIFIRRRGKIRFDCGLFFQFSVELLAFLLVFSCIGYLNGHPIIQILIDSYKYLDILITYLLFRASWQRKEDILQGLKSLTWLMLFLGLIEIFITTRGGVGLNLVMSLFPIVFALSLYHYVRYGKTILVLSLLIVASCQTRTYILGFVLGFALLMVLLPKEKREAVLSFSFIAGFFGMIALVMFGGQFFRSTLERFGELSAGFEESGGYRLYDYIEAINRFKEHPLIGHGLGFLRRTFIIKMGWMEWGDFVHCLYLEILFKVGISGSLYLIMIVRNLIRQILRGIKKYRCRDPYLFAVCCGSFCSFVIWVFTYTFTPLSTIGSMFVGPVIGMLAVKYGDGDQEMEAGVCVG